MFLTDTHIHLNSAVFKGKLQNFFIECSKQNIRRLIVPSTSLEENFVPFYFDGLDILFACGFHPFYADCFRSSVVYEFFFERCIAVGEIGLDFRKEIIKRVPVDLQIKAFVAQIGIAKEIGCPVLLHCVKAHEQMLKIMKEQHFINRGIVHGFSGATETAKRWIDLGFKLGIGPLILNNAASKLRRTVSEISCSDFLLETDAPFVFTDSENVLEIPQYLPKILSECSKLSNTNMQTILDCNEDSLKTLFKL